MSSPDVTPEELRAQLERRFRAITSRISIGRTEVEILHPANPEDLIDEAEFERDERLPYWADLWPSAIVLARRVARLNGAGKTLLELGCGSGLVASAAALAGFSVTASDYYDDSLAFTRVNVFANSGQDPEVRLVDWRSLPRDLPRFDMVVASDVLYERTYGELVAGVINRTLARGGSAMIADPGRLAAPTFVSACDRLGLRVRTVARVPYETAPYKQTIDLYDVRR